ncbi:MAG TPA: TRIC cation channel family protein [Streptosporangiaceae bacterium]|jgi:hypothetical protein
MPEPPLLLAFDLAGTFVFAVNGAIIGLEAARLDIVGDGEWNGDAWHVDYSLP